MLTWGGEWIYMEGHGWLLFVYSYVLPYVFMTFVHGDHSCPDL